MDATSLRAMSILQRHSLHTEMIEQGVSVVEYHPWSLVFPTSSHLETWYFYCTPGFAVCGLIAEGR